MSLSTFLFFSITLFATTLAEDIIISKLHMKQIPQIQSKNQTRTTLNRFRQFCEPLSALTFGNDDIKMHFRVGGVNI